LFLLEGLVCCRRLLAVERAPSPPPTPTPDGADAALCAPRGPARAARGWDDQAQALERSPTDVAGRQEVERVGARARTKQQTSKDDTKSAFVVRARRAVGTRQSKSMGGAFGRAR
jgi:hypothetical protein